MQDAASGIIRLSTKDEDFVQVWKGTGESLGDFLHEWNGGFGDSQVILGEATLSPGRLSDRGDDVRNYQD